ncbi:MAG: hypothetical protein NZ992_03805 [Candidatus Korarchaeum sp.]|nr:hypothetical protein [Candidatus Korarchaeum sp.]MDW8035099.1 hypothetical protein [Candidatus Korarchaeum sp.]
MRLALPALIMISVMLFGAAIYLIPSPRLGEEWPLPPESVSFTEFSSKLNSTSFSSKSFFLLGYQPVFSLGSGFEFPIGTNAYLYSLGYGNDTLMLLVISKLPDAQSSLQFGARAISRVREKLPSESVKYLFTDEGGYLIFTERNQTLSIWYGRSWFIETLITGSKCEEALKSLKELILSAIKS